MAMIEIFNEEEHEIYNRERRLDRKLRQKGYKLSRRKDGYGVPKYTAINENTNVIEAGEYVLSLEEMEAWIEQ